MRALACGLLFATACTFHSTDSNEVGVLTRKIALIGKAGVQPETYAPGATYMFMAFVTDWSTLKTSTQNLEMVADASRGDRRHRDDIEFKTHDGNDISVDVTISWRIDPSKAPYLVKHVGQNTLGVKDKLVRPLCRSLVRDVLNTMTSEEFYVSEKRYQKAQEAKDRLSAIAGPEGVLIESVLFGEHRFHRLYEAVIHDKKVAEQNAEKAVSEGKAAEQDALSKLATARGQVEQRIAKAAGELMQARLEADAELYRAKSAAEATRAEREAKAKGIRKQNEAMAGAGGRTLVKLRIAEALEGKAIVLIPSSGTGVGVNRLDVNSLVDSLLSREATGEQSQDEQ